MKYFHNSKGFSLIEVMIALGLMTYAALGLIRMQDQMTKQEISSTTRFDEQNLFANILSNLKTDRVCNFMIGSYCDDYSDKTGPLACKAAGKNWVSGVKLGNFSGKAQVDEVKNSQGRVIFKAGNNYGKSTLESIEIENLPQNKGGAPTNGIGKGRFKLIFKRESSKFVGAKEQHRYVDISLRLGADNRVKKCVSAGFNNIIPTDRLYINISQTPNQTNNNGQEFVASCDAGDLLLGGDCIQYSHGAAGDLVQGDGGLNISGTPNCSGCPNDAATCDSQCFNNEYNRYGCWFFNKKVPTIIKDDGTEISLNEDFSNIPIEEIKAIKVITKTYQELGGTSARGARALCLDRE